MNTPGSREREPRENEQDPAAEQVARLLVFRRVTAGEVLPRNVRRYFDCRYYLVEVQLEKACLTLGRRDLHGYSRRHQLSAGANFSKGEREHAGPPRRGLGDSDRAASFVPVAEAYTVPGRKTPRRIGNHGLIRADFVRPAIPARHGRCKIDPVVRRQRRSVGIAVLDGHSKTSRRRWKGFIAIVSPNRGRAGRRDSRSICVWPQIGRRQNPEDD